MDKFIKRTIMIVIVIVLIPFYFGVSLYEGAKTTVKVMGECYLMIKEAIEEV